MDGLEDGQLLEAKLVQHDRAYAALFGREIDYEKEDPGYNPDDPVWVVAIQSEQVDSIPFFGDGHYKGVIKLVTANDGESSTWISISDPDTDERLRKLRELPDLDGKLKIIPIPTQRPVEPPPTPTRIPR